MKNKIKNKNIDTTKQPIEDNITAALTNIKYQKDVSYVPIPGEDNVLEAKEWVDKNQK